MKHVPRQSAAAAVVAGAAGTAADAAAMVVVAVVVAAMVAVAGAAVIAAIVVIAGKQALPNLKAQRPGSGRAPRSLSGNPEWHLCVHDSSLRFSPPLVQLVESLGGRSVPSADEASRADIALGNIQ